MVNFLMFGIVTLLIFFVVTIFLRGDRSKKTVVRQVPLQQISELWTRGQRTGVLHIEELAPLWRHNLPVSKSTAGPYTFQSEQVRHFFQNHIEHAPWFDRAEKQRQICYQLLLVLEKEGDCPSVVNAAHDVEGSWDSSTYNLLGRTSLLDHTLHVAQHAVELLTATDAYHVIPDAMIAALAHDLGKLPSNRTHLYSLGEHPLAAGRVLAEIALLKELPRKDELLRAIKLHHMRPEGLLGNTLKKADQKARQQELEQAVEELRQTEPVAKAYPVGPEQNILVRKAEADIYGDENGAGEKSKDCPQLLDISAWFNGEAFLTGLQPYINRISGRQFMAFSMPDGYVYFQVKVLEEIARAQAEKAGAMDIATMDSRDKTMQQVLLTIVDTFRRQHQVIAGHLIKEQFFGGYFTIRLKGGRTMKGYYTPFKAEAFALLPLGTMEDMKTGILKNFTAVEVHHS